MKTVKFFLASMCVMSPLVRAMGDDRVNDNQRHVQISLGDVNNTNIENNQLIIYDHSEAHKQNNKRVILFAIDRLKNSLNEQKASTNTNVFRSTILFAAGAISYSIGCGFNSTSLQIVGLLQLLCSSIAGNFMNVHQAGEYHYHNVQMCNDLVQKFSELPDIENQLGN